MRLLAPALVLCGALMTACTGQEPAKPAESGVVALVNGKAITRATYSGRLGTVTGNPDVRTAIRQNSSLLPRLSGDVLSQMIDAELIEQAAAEIGVQVTDHELRDYIGRIVRDDLGGGPDAWQRFLRSSGYPESEVELALHQDLVREEVEDVLAPQARPSEQQVTEYFGSYYRDRPFVRHILVDEESQAARTLDKLRTGADFARLARELSTDHESAAQGGDLGPFAEGEYPASVEAAVEAAKDGDTIGPVQSAFGWHIIQRQAPLDIARAHDTIVQHLREVEQDRQVQLWVAGLRGKATVTVAPEFGSWNSSTGKVAS
nr:peptidylprolyl isomerase [Kibdelosporangium sp. MJ126-NF4]CEL18696.1 Peptidyl-prolyl cis-trans isomerase PpiD [Kibdelosporangium sp. MJ126-NF4]CTQ98180.1 Peptidyl-prolyl cis-trans isomerase PpiD (EC 5.2.1.8) [Kibdelosporangium sp. MJ126-NF4]